MATTYAATLALGEINLRGGQAYALSSLDGAALDDAADFTDGAHLNATQAGVAAGLIRAAVVGL